ncbi:MAG: SBBP repeat-containing protein, partial [Bacteroidota bacterium]
MKFHNSLCRVVLAVLVPSMVWSQTSLEYALSIGSVGFGTQDAEAIVLDSDNNLYTAGTFTGGIDFDPSVFVFEVNPVGINDAFVHKVDENGNFEWVKTFGGSNAESVLDIAIDEEGNLYTVGFFWNTADFDPGEDVFNLESQGSGDVFIQKLDNDGNFVWARSVGGGGNDQSTSIAISENGELYISGFFSNTIDLHPGDEELIFTAQGFTDIFTLKLDNDGNFLWAHTLGNQEGEGIFSNAVDSDGNFYALGSFNETMDLDPGAQVVNLESSGSSDIFIQKLNPNGELIWVKQVGGPGSDRAIDFDIDETGNLYITGWIAGEADLDPGAGEFISPSGEDNESFALKLNSSGEFVWASVLETDEFDSGQSITTDNNGSVYITGSFIGDIELEIFGESSLFTNQGLEDIYIWKLTEDGDHECFKTFGGQSPDAPSAIAVDNLGNIYSTGEYFEEVDFDPTEGEFILS